MDSAFDSRWYLGTYPDVAASGVDPALHYLAIGWREKRAPSAHFRELDVKPRPSIQLNPVSHAAFFAGVPADPPAPSWPVISIAPDANSGVASRLIIIDPPSREGMAQAGLIGRSHGPDRSAWFVYLNDAGDTLLFGRAIDAEPVGHLAWSAGGVISAAQFIRASGLQSVDIVYGAGARLDLDLFLDCLSHPFTLTLTDYAILAPDGALEDPRAQGDWPLRPQRFAARAETIRCANHAMTERLRSAAPQLPVMFWPVVKETGGPEKPILPPPSRPMTELTVLVWGDLTEAGGRRAVIDSAKLIAARNLPILVTVLGEIVPPLSAEEQGGSALTITGPRDGADRTELAHAIAPQLIWIPATAGAAAPFAMRAVVRSGIQILASDTPVLIEELQDQGRVAFVSATSDAAGWIEHMLHFMSTGRFDIEAGESGLSLGDSPTYGRAPEATAGS
jgi:hypothetical protein